MVVFEDTKDFRPRSILDTDLYKLTMQQAVMQHFPKVNATYAFTNWSKEMLFSRQCFELVKTSITRLSELKLQSNEMDWLRKNCPYFTEDYLKYLSSYRFRPKDQIKMDFHVTSKPGSSVEEGYITIDVTGLWVETILYEVPVMSIVSEAFFLTVDRGWSYEGQEGTELAYEKAKRMILNGLSFIDVGARRRRSYYGQDLVLQGLIRANREFGGEGLEGKLASTSNPHFAMRYGIAAIGIIAHEWIMGIAAIKGYNNANGIAMDLWEKTYLTTTSDTLHIALTDTFSTDVFNKDFKLDVERAKRWRGLRQDSGNPMEYISKAQAVYEQLGIDHRNKVIIFSDGLDVESAIKIKKATDHAGFIAAFGIGTFLMNDYKRLDNGERSMPLVMVVKPSSIEGRPCIKISDETSKNTGDPVVLERVKHTFGITA
ncbi:nicotinate phosphoribosyltransferase [Ceratobasidium sp. AG-I]|nr:nicotinate phosphoribosyltransferase [Ceratobasidium sp. AG-I]